MLYFLCYLSEVNCDEEIRISVCKTPNRIHVTVLRYKVQLRAALGVGLSGPWLTDWPNLAEFHFKGRDA